ncbi:hypothetical protein V8C86DRAFT_2505353 [Haematococcus lacustris]
MRALLVVSNTEWLHVHTLPALLAQYHNQLEACTPGGAKECGSALKDCSAQLRRAAAGLLALYSSWQGAAITLQVDLYLSQARGAWEASVQAPEASEAAQDLVGLLADMQAQLLSYGPPSCLQQVMLDLVGRCMAALAHRIGEEQSDGHEPPVLLQLFVDLMFFASAFKDLLSDAAQEDLEAASTAVQGTLHAALLASTPEDFLEGTMLHALLTAALSSSAKGTGKSEGRAFASRLVRLCRPLALSSLKRAGCNLACFAPGMVTNQV